MVKLMAQGWAVEIAPATGTPISTTWHAFSTQGLAEKSPRSLCGQHYGSAGNPAISELRSYTRIPQTQEACFYCVGVLRFKKDRSQPPLSSK